MIAVDTPCVEENGVVELPTYISTNKCIMNGTSTCRARNTCVGHGCFLKSWNVVSRAVNSGRIVTRIWSMTTFTCREANCFPASESVRLGYTSDH